MFLINAYFNHCYHQCTAVRALLIMPSSATVFYSCVLCTVLVSMNKINGDNDDEIIPTVSFCELTIGIARAIAACIMFE